MLSRNADLAARKGGLLLAGKEGRMLEQVDEEVGRAVEHGEQVGQVGHVANPIRPHQLTLQKNAEFYRDLSLCELIEFYLKTEYSCFIGWGNS
jgi:hypothetical protein